MDFSSGYYITAYCDIDPLGNVLKTSIRHDHNIALWKVDANEVSLLHHCELERISGYKHHRIPFFSVDDFYQFVDKILLPYGISHTDIKGYIGIKDISNSLIVEMNEKYAYHSLCHLYASMGMESDIFYNENILALSLDGEPDTIIDASARKKKYFAGAYSQKGKVELFPASSPGVLWSVAVDILGMQEGTLMALASASMSRSYEVYSITGTVENLDDVLSVHSKIRQICDNIMNYDEADKGKKFNFWDTRFSDYENRVSMIMKIIQEMSLEIVDRSIEYAIHIYGIIPEQTCIALGGGYALNCPTNTYIKNKYNFKKQLIIPCVNDGGQAVGIGLHFFYNNCLNVKFSFQNAYLGSTSNRYSEQFEKHIESVYNGLDLLVQDIESGPIIWYSGRSESGPRALGNRSLLADPRRIESKNRLNEIKKREWWRPVAPIVLEEECAKWFKDCFESEYMLNNFSIKNDKEKLVPAIVHLDGTSRVQTVNKENKCLYQVLKMFYERTGIPILCNTSLNDKGEPIVDTIDQVFNFALRKKIEIVYINGKRYKMRNFESYSENKPMAREEELFVPDSQIIEKINAYNITAREYFMYKNCGLLPQYNFEDEGDVKRFKKMMTKVNSMYIRRTESE